MKKTDSLFKQLHQANERIKQLQKELDEVRDSYIKHTESCETWGGGKLILIENLEKENKTLKEQLNNYYITVNKL